MIPDFYNLREQPFGVTPDPRFLYPSATHLEALGSLLYGITAGRGFVALIARPGMGKTTLLFEALSQIRNGAQIVFLSQMICTPVDFLRALLTDLGVDDVRGDLIELQSQLNQVLKEHFRSGRPLIVIIDEAQNLNDSVLELVRMLSNFETSRDKLIQIVLSGQPQLAERLAEPQLLQLRQRISIFACLKPFSPQDTSFYVEHRMKLAGHGGAALFTRPALEMIAHHSEGIPRNINNLCFNALSLGCAMKRRTIDCDIVREIVSDLDLTSLQGMSPAVQTQQESIKESPALLTSASERTTSTRWPPKLAIACAIVLVVGGGLFNRHQREIPGAVARANRVVPPLAPAISPSVSTKPTPQLPPAPSALVVPGQTLYEICAEKLGSCNWEHLQKIRKLNPWLTDVDHIEPGEWIRFTSDQVPSADAEGTSNQSGNGGMKGIR